LSHELKIYELAETDYMNGLKYKEIAEKYNVTINTVKSWKTRYGWNRKGKKSVHTKQEKVCTQKEMLEESVEKVNEQDELTDKQKLFCVYYIRSFNATKAYQKAYGCKYETAQVKGSILLRKKKIKDLISELRQSRLNREILTEEDIFQRYMDIAFADMTDYFSFDSTHIVANNSDEVDGSLIDEIRIFDGRVSAIKLPDRMKALQWLSEHMNIATDEQKLRIKQMQVDIDRKTGHGNDDELTKVDELLNQLKMNAVNMQGKKQAGDE